jgi:hypothetical protein
MTCRKINTYEYRCDGWLLEKADLAGKPCRNTLIVHAYNMTYSDAAASRDYGWIQSGDLWYCHPHINHGKADDE